MERSSEVLSGTEKAKLQVVLQSVDFVNSNEVGQYKCCNCGQIALYHYVATCKHTFCGKRHGQLHAKQCPFENCRNTSINEILQDKTFELGVYQLKAYCTFQKNGCLETVDLANLLVHQHECKFSTKKLLPKLWIPPESYAYIKQLEVDVALLKTEMKELRDKTEKTEENSREKHEILERQFLTFSDQNVKVLEDKSKKMTISIACDVTESFNEKFKSKSSELKNYIQQAIEQLNTQRDELKSSLNSKFNGKSEELSGQLVKSIDDKAITINADIDSKTKDLVNSIQAEMKNLKTRHETIVENLNLAVNTKLDERLKLLEKSTENYADSLSTKLDEKAEREAQEMRKVFAKEVCDFKQELEDLKSCITQKANNNTKKVDEQITLLKGTNFVLAKEVCDFKQELEDLKSCITQKADNNTKKVDEQITLLKGTNFVLAKEVCDFKQELEDVKSCITQKADNNTKKVDEQITLFKGFVEKTTQENQDMKVWMKDICNYTTQFHWRIFDWQKVQKKGKDIVSDVFQTKDYGLKMKGKISFENNYCYPWVELVYDSFFSKPHAFIYQHRRTFVITIQNDDEETKEFQIVQDPRYDSDDAEFWMTGCKKLTLSRFKFLNADFIEVKIIIEPVNISYNNFYSTNGILIWKLDNYFQYKQDGITFGHCLWSEYFYAAERYRLKVGLIFSNNRVEFYVFDVHGQLDNIYNWSSCYLTAIIVNQSNSNTNKDLIIYNKDLRKFTPDLLYSVTCDKLETSDYLKDGRIIIKVIVRKNV